MKAWMRGYCDRDREVFEHLANHFLIEPDEWLALPKGCAELASKEIRIALEAMGELKAVMEYRDDAGTEQREPVLSAAERAQTGDEAQALQRRIAELEARLKVHGSLFYPMILAIGSVSDEAGLKLLSDFESMRAATDKADVHPAFRDELNAICALLSSVGRPPDENLQ
jgi:hypothetical protein